MYMVCTRVEPVIFEKKGGGGIPSADLEGGGGGGPEPQSLELLKIYISENNISRFSAFSWG